VSDARDELEQRVILWRNVFVFVDDGTVRPEVYVEAERRVRARAAAYRSQGIGCVVVLPDASRPPPEEVRAAIVALLDRLSGVGLRGLVYVVESSGFSGAAVRAALTGMLMVRRRPYATAVRATVRDGLAWLLPYVRQAAALADEADLAISEGRARWTAIG
jgi:hypothetical protein